MLGGLALRWFGRLHLFGLHHRFPVDCESENLLLGRDAHPVHGLGWVFVRKRAEKVQAIPRAIEFQLALAQVNLVDAHRAQRVGAEGGVAVQPAILVERN